MAALWQNLFSGNFIPHGHCYLWKPGLVWLHVLSDTMIALAYYAIPLMLVYFVRQRRDLPFDWVFVLFGGFIIACGTGHLIEVWTLWHPVYWLAGSLKAITALISIYTAFQLVWLIPKALALPSPAQLEATNRKLEIEILERLRTQEELIRERDFSQILVESSPAFFVALDTLGKIIRMNASMLNALDYTLDEVVGKDYLSNFVPESDRQMVSLVFNLLVQQQQPTQNENRVLTKDGRELLVEWHRRPVYKENGEFEFFFGMGIDITERKKAEEEMQRTQNFLVTLVENIPVGVFMKEPEELRFVFWNKDAEEMFGYSRQEALYKNDYDFFPKEQADFFTGCDRETLAAGKLLEIKEELVQTRHKGLRILHTKKLPILDATGKPQYLLGFSEDITERKQAEQALRESEARYKQLAQQEELLNRLGSHIRNSLDLDTILETAVQEIRNLLQIDRCLFVWLRRNSFFPLVQNDDEREEKVVWEVVKEAQHPNLQSLIGSYPVEENNTLVEKVFNLEILGIDDVETLSDPALGESLVTLGYKSLLMLPIQTQSGEIGIVSCGHSSLRPWNDFEVELLQAVTDQLAIAINQAELYAQSQEATKIAQAQTQQLEHTLHQLQQTQAQLIQSEKMSSLGQLVAGVAHEINNPVSFIYGNLIHASEYIRDLLDLVQLYEQHYPNPVPKIKDTIEKIDLEFLKSDLPKLLSSMNMGANRIRQIVISLRNFSRLDEAEMKEVDIHEGIENTLLILQSRLKETGKSPRIQMLKEYDKLPLIECHAGQINQVFMNILSNAIDALEMEKGEEEIKEIENKAISILSLSSSSYCHYQSQTPTIRIETKVIDNSLVEIRIVDNGPGMTEEVKKRLFDPFFTTKPVGKGTGLGLSISYQIVVEKHGGKLQCISAPKLGAEFIIQLPVKCIAEGRRQRAEGRRKRQENQEFQEFRTS